MADILVCLLAMMYYGAIKVYDNSQSALDHGHYAQYDSND